MIRKKRITLLFFIALVISLPFITHAQKSSTEENTIFKWHRINGSWQVKDSEMYSIRKHAIQWRSHELINFNSLITTANFKNFNQIDTKIKAFSPLEKREPELMLFFSARSPYKFYFYYFYAFKFSGDNESISKVSFIKSERIDATKSYKAKNNYKVEELAEAKCSLKFDRKYSFSIKFKDNHAILFIDGKEILKGKLPADGYEGHVGFSNRNCRISIDDYKIINEGILSDDVIFHDDFSKDLIKRRSVKIKRVKNKR